MPLAERDAASPMHRRDRGAKRPRPAGPRCRRRRPAPAAWERSDHAPGASPDAAHGGSGPLRRCGPRGPASRAGPLIAEVVQVVDDEASVALVPRGALPEDPLPDRLEDLGDRVGLVVTCVGDVHLGSPVRVETRPFRDAGPQRSVRPAGQPLEAASGAGRAAAPIRRERQRPCESGCQQPGRRRGLTRAGAAIVTMGESGGRLADSRTCATVDLRPERSSPPGACAGPRPEREPASGARGQALATEVPERRPPGTSRRRRRRQGCRLRLHQRQGSVSTMRWAVLRTRLRSWTRRGPRQSSAKCIV